MMAKEPNHLRAFENNNNNIKSMERYDIWNGKRKICFHENRKPKYKLNDMKLSKIIV